jgi:glycine/D-amino acid oxidase-like deaminating enzyme/nitrite reductase/ring-hydroxylating ferredoxin subunit
MYDPDRTHGAQTSIWYEQLSDADTITLATNCGSWPEQTLDLIVVGAGMAGLSTAYHAAKLGMSVLVLDKGLIGSGETGRSTAHVSNALDDRYYMLQRQHGREGARLAAASHAAAIGDIAKVVEQESIECGFTRVPGYLFAAQPGGAGARELRRELTAARKSGVLVNTEPSFLPALGDRSWLHFPNQAEFQPLAYLAGLARAIARLGGRIFTRTRVVDVTAGHGEQRVQLEAGATLTARAVVVATNSPINDVFAIHTKQAAYRSYVLAFSIAPSALARGLYWDTGDPYHYVRLAADGDILIAGGEDHKVGQSAEPEKHWQQLERWTRTHFPMAQELRSRWSGQIQEPADGLAYIGKNPGSPGQVFIVSGDSGNGITHGAIAGLLLPELICGRDQPWAELYSPGRKLRALRTRAFVRENVNVALHFAQRLLPGQRGEHAVPLGEGRVIRRGGRHVALFVAPDGTRHECSATCPHLGCVVAWNGAERSWDCPCHGSRFDAYGKVMTGPAARDLQPLTASAADGSDAASVQKESGTHGRTRPHELLEHD